MSEHETIRVVYNEGEEKPWEVSLEGVGLLGTARAVLNHPGRHFEDQQEAIEVAEKIRELVKADNLEVQASPTAEGGTLPLAQGDTSVTREDEDPVQASYLDDDKEPVQAQAGVTGYPEPVKEGVFLDTDPDEDDVATQPSDPYETVSATEEYRDLAVDEGLSTPEPTSYQDYSEEDVSSAVQPTPAAPPATSGSASFFGEDDSADRVRADEYHHPEGVEEPVSADQSGTTEPEVKNTPGGLPPRPVPPPSVFGEGSKS